MTDDERSRTRPGAADKITAKTTRAPDATVQARDARVKRTSAKKRTATTKPAARKPAVTNAASEPTAKPATKRTAKKAATKPAAKRTAKKTTTTPAAKRTAKKTTTTPAAKRTKKTTTTPAAKRTAKKTTTTPAAKRTAKKTTTTPAAKRTASTKPAATKPATSESTATRAAKKTVAKGMTSAKATKKASPRGPLLVVGWREWSVLTLDEPTVVRAKIDTGAASSAVHASNIVLSESDEGHLLADFHLHLDEDRSRTRLVTAHPVVGSRMVLSSSGHWSTRPVVTASLQLGGVSFETDLTLASRGEMEFRLLIGRAALRRRFAVDPSQSFLLGEPQ